MKTLHVVYTDMREQKREKTRAKTGETVQEVSKDAAMAVAGAASAARSEAVADPPAPAEGQTASMTRIPESESELKGSVGEGPNQTSYSDRSSGRSLSKFRNFR